MGTPLLVLGYSVRGIGDRADFIAFVLQQLAERPGSDKFFVSYAEDAESMGLWGWEAGYLPQATWANLDGLLSDLEAFEPVCLRHLSEAKPVETLGPLPDGAGLRARICSSVMRPAEKSSRRLRGTSEPLPPLG